MNTSTLKRRAELALAAASVASARSPAAATRQKALSKALAAHEHGADLASALTTAGVDPATI